MHVLVVGAGVVGTRLVTRLAATSLCSSDAFDQITVADRLTERAERLASRLGNTVQACSLQALLHKPLCNEVDVVVLALPPGSHTRLANRFLQANCLVLSTSDALGDVRSLLTLESTATEHDALLVVGVGMAPGLSDVLASRAAIDLDCVTEVHVAKFGTGGPACARQHHRALRSFAVEWNNGWQQRPGGSGRELCWFPSPVDAADCYRAAMGDPLILARRFPQATKISARIAATRRDRFTSWLPMLRSPHPEGKLGAVRVDVRGKRNGAWSGRILGAAAPPATATVTVLLSVLHLVANQQIQAKGAMSLSEVVKASDFLTLTEQYGLISEEFVGS
ncbi:MAG: Gfo/Idh/MocA family oxidoreductase [bacterium]|nr:Gfo/Idh/MocA family oxidoreductase [bacterium]MCY4258201.1 Gfo/Idh/MocA family oxidoreductase [bacterium]